MSTNQDESGLLRIAPELLPGMLATGVRIVYQDRVVEITRGLPESAELQSAAVRDGYLDLTFSGTEGGAELTVELQTEMGGAKAAQDAREIERRLRPDGDACLTGIGTGGWWKQQTGIEVIASAEKMLAAGMAKDDVEGILGTVISAMVGEYT